MHMLKHSIALLASSPKLELKYKALPSQRRNLCTLLLFPIKPKNHFARFEEIETKENQIPQSQHFTIWISVSVRRCGILAIRTGGQVPICTGK